MAEGIKGTNQLTLIWEIMTEPSVITRVLSRGRGTWQK